MLSSQKYDYHHVTSGLVREEARDGDIYLIGANLSLQERYVKYHVEVDVFYFQKNEERFDEFFRIARTQLEKGKRIFIHDTLLMPDSHFLAEANENRGVVLREALGDSKGKRGAELILF